MDLQKIEQYNLNEKELKEALRMYFETKKGIKLNDNQISFNTNLSRDAEPYDFTGHIKIVTNTKDV